MDQLPCAVNVLKEYKKTEEIIKKFKLQVASKYKKLFDEA